MLVDYVVTLASLRGVCGFVGGVVWKFIVFGLRLVWAFNCVGLFGL